MSAVARTIRLVSGVAVVALVAGAVGLGARWSSPATGEVLSSGAVVQVPPSPTRLVCPGPLVLPERRESDAAFDPVPVDPLTSLVAAATSVGGGRLADLTGAQTLAPLGEGVDAAVVRDAPGPVVVEAEPTDVPAAVGAASSALVTAGDLRGLAAASCRAPTTDAWLVGGSTELGATALLVLQNAGSTPAVVHLDVYGATGEVDLPTEQYLVAPGAERVVVLGGLAPQERRIAVHVAATGGRVTAFVQDSTLEGFTPTGTDLVVPGAEPARRQVVPAVMLLATDVDDPDAGLLRLLVPGDEPATARVRLLGPDGVEPLPGAEALVLEPGVVTDVPLGGLPQGAYTIVVDADHAVVASAMLARPGEPTPADPQVPTRERAWVASLAPTPQDRSQDSVLALPDRSRGTLVLGAVTRTGELDGAAPVEAEVRLLGSDGEVVATEHVELTVGRSVALTLADVATPDRRLTGVQVVPADGRAWIAAGLVAQVQRSDGVLLSVLLPVPGAAGTTSTTVREDLRLGTR